MTIETRPYDTTVPSQPNPSGTTVLALGWEQSRHYAAFRSSPISRVPFGRQAVPMCSGTIETQRFPGIAPSNNERATLPRRKDQKAVEEQ